jgi:gamma-glutamyltranspeptidase/glutathione hydrolase
MRSAASLAILSMTLSGCGTLHSVGESVGLGSDDKASNAVESRYLGSIVADDPQAVDLARRVLGSGGTAADAAAVLAMTLAVTQPGRAGLDGGGICLIKPAGKGGIDQLDFLPQSVPGAALQVPGLVRGMAALQVRYGALHWQQVLAPVEHLATTGITVTPQLLIDLQAAGLGTDGPDGKRLQVGDLLPQRGVAATLSKLRVGGPAEFYTGGLASSLVAAGVPGTALANYVPTWRATAGSAGDGGIFFAQGQSGLLAQAAWQALSADKAAADPAAFNTARQAATAALPRSSEGGLDQATATTGFLVTDVNGQVVSCAIGMGSKLFGTGQIIEPLGVFAASGFDAATLASLAPMIALDPGRGQVLGAFAGAASPAAPADAAVVAWLSLHGKRPLDQAIAEPRVASDSGATLAADRVSAIVCPDGLRDKPGSCSVQHDPRGFGFAIQADNLIR